MVTATSGVMCAGGALCVALLGGCSVFGLGGQTPQGSSEQVLTPSITAAAPSGPPPQRPDPGHRDAVAPGVAIADAVDQPQACALLDEDDVTELTGHGGVSRGVPSIVAIGKATAGRDDTIIQQCRFDTDVSTITYKLAVFPGPAVPVLKAERQELPMTSSFYVGVGEYSLGTVFATPVLNASRVDAAVENYVVTVTSDHRQPVRAQHEVTVVGKVIVKRLQAQLDTP